VLLALSFPRFGHPAFAWIALTPLLVAISGRSIPRAFGLGLTTGIVHFVGTLYWITHVMAQFGGLPLVVAVLVNAALVAYLALFPALFAAVTCRILVAFGPRFLMVAPLVWVATELGRTYLFTGFPWVLLGYSQVSVLPVAQFASVAGVYGVSALVSAAGAAAAMVAVAPARKQWQPAVAATTAVIGIVTLLGAMRLRDGELTRDGEPLRVGVVQGNIDQAVKWDAGLASTIFDSYLRLTYEAIDGGARLVVWPESSAPFRFGEDRAGTDRIRELARDTAVSMIVGSDEIEREPSLRYFNSAFLVRPDGSTGGVYRKLHLVPFGEYVPLKRVFFFAAPLVEAVADFSPGTTATLLPVGDRLVSTAICYEIVYPDLVRQFVRGGSELLITITNDAWFGRTSAPHQHFAQAAMRAIENGRYLVRSANTGISGVVDPYGRVLVQSDLFEPAVIVRDVRYLRASTFYARTGDLFAYLSVVAVAAMLVAARRRVQYRSRSYRARAR
jgi:apolipoprotein N-acyltransferase